MILLTTQICEHMYAVLFILSISSTIAHTRTPFAHDNTHSIYVEIYSLQHAKAEEDDDDACVAVAVVAVMDNIRAIEREKQSCWLQCNHRSRHHIIIIIKDGAYKIKV